MKYIVSFLMTASMLPSSAEAADVDRPNIVLIMADDVGADAVGCYGGETYPTPTIDVLAKGGMRFNHCYSMPSCHPTRVCLMTGQYPRRLKNPKWGTFPRDVEKNTIGPMMQQAGYATAVAGKWQIATLGADLEHPHRMGFDQYSLFGWHEGPRYYQPLIWQNGKRREDVNERYGPEVYCQFLIDFMRQNRDKPFFAYYPMALCHDVTDDLDQPVPYGPHGRYDSYAEMMAHMDRLISRLVAEIDVLGIRHKTLILFTGDNGTAARSIIRAEDGKYIREDVFTVYKGKRIQGGKTKLTDGGTHVPLIANWPGVIETGQVVNDLVDFSDFLPTLAELSGGTLPVGVTLDGHSFAGRILRGRTAPREWAYAEAPGNKYWVRTQRWKHDSDGRWFHMRDDPFETAPLETGQLPSTAESARELLTRAIQQVADF